jgi:predicted CoA-binding protein
MRVMIIGASTDPTKYGHRAVRAYEAAGHEVLPVHPTAREVAGHRVYAEVGQVPGPIDRATVYLPPEKTVKVLAEIAQRGDVAEVWINPGAESEQVFEEAKRLGLGTVFGCSIIAARP